MSEPHTFMPDDLLIELRSGGTEPTLVVGVGSHHGKDAIGWLMAERLNALDLPGVTVRRALVPLDLLDWLEDYTVVHLIDAMQDTDAAADFRRWEWPDCQGIGQACGSTHGFDLVSVLRLAEQLGKAQARIVIWGIQALGQ